MNKQQRDRLFYKTIIDKMFEIAGHPLTFEDVEYRQDNWFQQYTMTEEQNKQWREWCVPLFMKKKRYKKNIAERAVAMLDLYCGLKIENK